jgi:hypothetical protein
MSASPLSPERVHDEGDAFVLALLGLRSFAGRVERFVAGVAGLPLARKRRSAAQADASGERAIVYAVLGAVSIARRSAAELDAWSASAGAREVAGAREEIPVPFVPRRAGR